MGIMAVVVFVALMSLTVFTAIIMVGLRAKKAHG